jgi:ABC-type sugar transport system permease subunit
VPSPRVARYGGAYLFVIPSLVFYVLFVVLPAVQTLIDSLYDLPALGFGAKGRAFIGLGNYAELWRDPIFWASFRNNVTWLFLTLAVPTALGLGAAILLQKSDVPGRSVFRAIYFFPQILTPVVIATIWKVMYDPSIGPINAALRTIGLGDLAPLWLGDFNLALPALFVMFAWAHYGFCMVIFLAGLQSVDPSLYDAARVDGANAWQEFRDVTVPCLRNAFTVIYIIGIISAFKVFDFVYVGTKGGPGYSTYVLSYQMFLEAFPHDRAGYGSALAVANAFIIAVLAAGFLWFRRRGESQ